MQEKYLLTIENAKEQSQQPISTQEPDRKFGRPKKYTENLKNLKVYLPERNYQYIKENGWKYDGMNGLINHLIEEDMKKAGRL